MVTWEECFQDPRGETKQLSPVQDISIAQLLIWASEAQHLLQRKTQAVQRELKISYFNSSGEADLDDDVGDVWLAEIVDSQGRAQIKAQFRSFQEYRMIRRNRSGSSGCEYVCTVARRKFFIDPIPSNKVILSYSPFLLPYSPYRAGISGDWSEADANNLSDFIENNGPEQEFWSDLVSIKHYVSTKIFESAPLLQKMHYTKYKRHFAEWESALLDAASRQPNYSINDSAPSYSPIR